jgi:C4-dicarboxylate-specific signal transduction histidine kinase
MVSALIGDLIILPTLMLHMELVTAWDLLRLMPTLGGMTPGIAHELIQPLNAIKMGSEFLKIILGRGARIKEGEKLLQVANEISRQVDRASGIINRLTEFGKRGEITKKRVDVNQPIRETLAIIENQLSLDNIKLEVDLEEHLPPILAHTNRLGQVIFNLVHNASEAINAKKGVSGDAGSRKIRVRSYREGERVVVSVFDNGIGIPAHLRDRVFEPFFTGKEPGKGKGLGLTITNEIVKDYGGRIVIESKIGIGTTFRIFFPASL